MVENRSKTNSRIIIGFILLIVGVLFLLDNLNFLYFDVPHVIFSFPTILILIGILILVNSERKGAGIILIIIGGLWLLPRIFPWISINGGGIFSILIIALGIYILAKRRGHYGYNNYNKTVGTEDNGTTNHQGAYSRETDRDREVAFLTRALRWKRKIHRQIPADRLDGRRIHIVKGQANELAGRPQRI